MSWSIRKIVMPAFTTSRSRSPRARLSALSRPAAGSSMHTSRGPAASARATPTSLRWPCESWSGIFTARSPSPSTSSAWSAPLIPRRRGTHDVGQDVPPGGLRRRDLQVVGDGEVVEELEGLPRPGQPRPGTDVRSDLRDLLAVEEHLAGRGHEAGDRVDEGRLAGTVRTDQPDQHPLFDANGDLVDGPQAAERHRKVVGVEQRQSHRLLNVRAGTSTGRPATPIGTRRHAT